MTHMNNSIFLRGRARRAFAAVLAASLGVTPLFAQNQVQARLPRTSPPVNLRNSARVHELMRAEMCIRDSNTTLGGYRVGARVNLECDVLAKHVEKLLAKLDLKSPLTIEKLRENGY